MRGGRVLASRSIFHYEVCSLLGYGNLALGMVHIMVRWVVKFINRGYKNTSIS